MIGIGRRAKRKIRKAIGSYTNKMERAYEKYKYPLEKYWELERTLSPTEKEGAKLKLRTTIYREIATYYILPEILFQLKIPKEKKSQAKKILKLMLNGLADAYEDYIELILKTKNEKERIQAAKDHIEMTKIGIEEAEKELEKIGIKRNLKFLEKLVERRLRGADRYQRYLNK